MHATYIKLRLARRQAKLVVVERQEICTDCGIDLDRGWHWDNCSRDPKRADMKAALR